MKNFLKNLKSNAQLLMFVNQTASKNAHHNMKHPHKVWEYGESWDQNLSSRTNLSSHDDPELQFLHPQNEESLKSIP